MAGIYIHIPFCKQACHYCNFYFSTSLANKQQLLKALHKEIELSTAYLAGEPIETIYFGGGTPTLLSTQEILDIYEILNKHYNLSHLQEFTIEANPDDLDKAGIEKIRLLEQIGLNRLSIGVQSFFDEDLQYMNRAHNSLHAQQCIKQVQDAGFSNITIDLIYGTPTMNDDKWRANLQTAFALNIPHISSYALTVEPKTTLHRKIKKGESKPVNEDQSANQFTILVESMRQAGYEQYEISNFAKPGKYAVHNTNYWRGKKYLGLGPSAHSFNIVGRRWNVANNIGYINSLAQGILPFTEERLTHQQQVNEKIMTSLRTQWGLNSAELNLTDWLLIKENLLPVEPAFYTLINGNLLLNDAGKLFADAISSQLFLEE